MLARGGPADPAPLAWLARDARSLLTGRLRSLDPLTPSLAGAPQTPRRSLASNCAKILRMEQDLSAFRPSRVWKRLPLERRMAAAELFWQDEQSTDQQVEAISLIAGHMKFRTKSVLGLPAEKRMKYLATLPNISDTVAARALVNYHLGHQRPMMASFLDSLGVAHDNGLINEEQTVKPDNAKLREAAGELTSKFPPDDVSLYFATLISQDPETWGDLAAAMPELEEKTQK
jgi:hypothetical protein